ncbi:MULTISPECIES: uroporphyrinogen-III synthase [unclassified Sinorhizobium]|uniref:uroporphyrinogen-III synthase n=1 Tax=unclassified Sinorhizobium TaxID=2613772 RepID=UPI0024C46F61|nr:MULTISPECIES: uroporphyrinogen-III synthase [unclassified Sinorhizobium]MDK1377206.1 uroporphyrinogen-III synthase [Sinorhizobium sp. 6-70]MDK1478827.1 uroporphyrinogen-III synthase [Sinorhizobium sp. 6-117]
MRVLVTRPRPAAAATALKLEAMGHEAILLPLMQAEHLLAAVETALKQGHRAIALTSAEATRVLAALGGALEPHVATPLFCVGQATGRAAADLGFADMHIGPGTGEGLAETIAAAFGATPPGPLLYLAGSPRSDGLERALRQRGIDHRTVECYRMTPVDHRPDELSGLLRAGQFEAVLLYSREAARQFAALLLRSRLSAAAFSRRYLCLSAAIAEGLPPDATVEVAAMPDEEHLLQLL